MNSYNLRELQDIYEGYKRDGRGHLDTCKSKTSPCCYMFSRINGKVQALALLIRNKNGGSLIL